MLHSRSKFVAKSLNASNLKAYASFQRPVNRDLPRLHHYPTTVYVPDGQSREKQYCICFTGLLKRRALRPRDLRSDCDLTKHHPVFLSPSDIHGTGVQPDLDCIPAHQRIGHNE